MKGNYYDIAVGDLHFAKVGINSGLGEEAEGDNFEWIDYETIKLCYDYATDIKAGIDAVIENPENESRLKKVLLNKYKR